MSGTKYTYIETEGLRFVDSLNFIGFPQEIP
jgi:hypothetical protein